MRKAYSHYSNGNYNYTYYYGSKKVVLRTMINHAQEFKNYFGKDRIEFNSLKEFKYNINNYNKHINKEIIFKHIFTAYIEKDYVIERSNNSWEIRLKTKNKSNEIKFKYGVLEVYNDSYFILLNKKGIKRFKEKDYPTKDLSLSYHYGTLRINRFTRKQAINDIETYIDVFEIKEALENNQ